MANFQAKEELVGAGQDALIKGVDLTSPRIREMLSCFPIVGEQVVHKLLVRLAIQSCNNHEGNPRATYCGPWPNSANKIKNSKRRRSFLAK